MHQLSSGNDCSCSSSANALRSSALASSTALSHLVVLCLKTQLSSSVKEQSDILCPFSSIFIAVSSDLVPHDINRDIREKSSSQSWNQSCYPSSSLPLGCVAPDSFPPAFPHDTRLLTACSRPQNLTLRIRLSPEVFTLSLLNPYELLS